MKTGDFADDYLSPAEIEALKPPEDRRARERFGWRPSRARPCPLVVLNRHCRIPYEGHCKYCVPWLLGPLRRQRVWLASDGQRMLTGESWDLGRDHAYMSIALAPLGIEVWAAGPGFGLVEPRAALVIVAPAGRTGP